MRVGGVLAELFTVGIRPICGSAGREIGMKDLVVCREVLIKR